MTLAPLWLERLIRWTASLPKASPFALCFPIYRPDLVQEAAKALDLDFADFRARRMAPLGWQASTLTTVDVDQFIRAAMENGRGLVLHNIEAMLSFVAPAERQAWIAQTLETDWPCRLVLPFAVFNDEVPQTGHAQRYDVTSFELPAEPLLDRLSGLH